MCKQATSSRNGKANPQRTGFQAGFTLVEMAIVLVIIGLILSAISIGKDLQREAEYAKIDQKFVAAWKEAYDTYYKRTGGVVGDCQVAPTYMVDGREVTLQTGETCVDGFSGGTSGGGSAGIPANYTNTGVRICHGQGYAENTVGAGDPPISTNPDQDLHVLMDRAGIRMPPGRAEGQEDRYLYLDSNGNPVELQVCFQWNPDRTISGAGNVLVLRGLTPDLARTLDQLIDGKPDALEGRFRQQNAASNDSEQSSQRPGVQWASNNTYRQPDQGASTQNQTALGSGENKDEDRVALLTAHWIMDQ